MNIKTGNLIEGALPPRVLKLSKDWIKENASEALKQGERMERGEQVLHKTKWS